MNTFDTGRFEVTTECVTFTVGRVGTSCRGSTDGELDTLELVQQLGETQSPRWRHFTSSVIIDRKFIEVSLIHFII